MGLREVLSSWYKSDRERFDSVSDSLAASVNFKIGFNEIGGVNQLCLLEEHRNPISLQKASEGTLRLIAYYTLLHQDELPPLIAIEEPERNLHPGALKEIAYVLERLAERTQVVITTHSSQLLDSFSSKNLSDWLGVLLLRNRPALGTEVLNLEDIRTKREALDGWIADFGIGSAVFDSELLQDLMEEPVC
jgi:predicted ATPase